jgi:hypothetical protein
LFTVPISCFVCKIINYFSFYLVLSEEFEFCLELLLEELLVVSEVRPLFELDVVVELFLLLLFGVVLTSELLLLDVFVVALTSGLLFLEVFVVPTRSLEEAGVVAVVVVLRLLFVLFRVASVVELFRVEPVTVLFLVVSVLELFPVVSVVELFLLVPTALPRVDSVFDEFRRVV